MAHIAMHSAHLYDRHQSFFLFLQLDAELMTAKKENRLLTCRSVLYEQLLAAREDYLNLIRSPNKGVSKKEDSTLLMGSGSYLFCCTVKTLECVALCHLEVFVRGDVFCYPRRVHHHVPCISKTDPLVATQQHRRPFQRGATRRATLPRCTTAGRSQTFLPGRRPVWMACAATWT